MKTNAKNLKVIFRKRSSYRLKYLNLEYVVQFLIRRKSRNLK